MAKNKTIVAEGINVTIFKDSDHNFISLTDMQKAKDNDLFIAD